jgi:hypothetical protein
VTGLTFSGVARGQSGMSAERELCMMAGTIVTSVPVVSATNQERFQLRSCEPFRIWKR